MLDNPNGFPRLSYERLLEIRGHLSWIAHLLEILAGMGLILIVRSFLR